MNYKNSSFKSVYIGETISVAFKNPVFLIKKPRCPDSIVWRESTHVICELLSEWQDFERKGKLSRNMKDVHLQRAGVKGSLGVGRFYFRVRTSDLRIFDIYYDRAVRNASESGGFWVLFQELIPD